MKTMQHWISELSNKSDKMILALLEETIKEIDFLESIYITGKPNNVFSKQFNDAAYNERQALCQLSSALYHIKRERKL
jgi:hypothetical protein